MKAPQFHFNIPSPAPVGAHQTLAIKMKFLRPILCLVLCAFALSSCKTFYTTETDGTAALRANGFRLPTSIGSFQRAYIRTFDSSGHNVGAGYNYYSQEQKAGLTVFILSASDGSAPTEAQRGQYFQASRNEVLSAHQDSKDMGVSKIAGHDSGGSLNEFQYDEEFAGSQQRVASFLAVFRDGSRLIKYRITGPKSERDQVYSSLTQAISSLSKIN
jgi:hypothetical protein